VVTPVVIQPAVPLPILPGVSALYFRGMDFGTKPGDNTVTLYSKVTTL